MKHLKRTLAICLCLFLAFEVASPALPKLGDWFSLRAKAVPVSWDLETSEVDEEAELESLKNLVGLDTDTDGYEKIRKNQTDYDGWYHLYANGGVSAERDDCYNLCNWGKYSDSKLRDYFQSTDPKYEKIILETDIGQTYQEKSSWELDGNGYWVGACVISSNKVIDLNGHQMKFITYKCDSEITFFHITGNNTTVVIMDSSPDQTGLISFHGQYHDTKKKYSSHITTNLFEVHDGATVYVLGGNFVAGGMKLENVETGWMKFKRIGGSLLRSALTCASAAFSVYSAITTGGVASDAGGALDKVAGLIGMDDNSKSLVTTDHGKTEAKGATVQNPAGGKNLEADTEDVNGKNSKNKPNGDTNASAGKGASVLTDIKGVYICTNEDGTPLYDQPSIGAHEIWRLDYGDEVLVIEQSGKNYYKVKEGSQFYYCLKNDLEAKLDMGPRPGATPFPDDRETLDGLQMDAENTAEDNKKDRFGNVMEFVTTFEESGAVVKMNEAVNAYAATYGSLTADKGKFYQIHWGTVFKMISSSKLIVLGGTFWGHGQDAENRDEVIETTAGKTYIYGGEFKGLGGANIFSNDVDGAHLSIRGGTFDCSSVNCIRGRYDSSIQGDEADKTEQLTGTRGYVNVPLSCYGEDNTETGDKLISDGRIQLNETAGAGELVIRNTDPEDSNRITYSIYCSEESIKNVSHLSVYPHKSDYMENAFKLVGDAENDNRPNTVPDGMLDGKGYIDFACGNEFAYVAPLINAQTPDQVIAGANSSSLEAAIDNTGIWYYNMPLNDYFKNLRGFSVYAKDEDAVRCETYDMISTLRLYTYDLYTIDPVTQENLKLCAHKEVPSCDILTGMIRLIPSTGYTDSEDGYDNTYYLMSASKWKPGTYYRVTLTVSEYVRVGYAGSGNKIFGTESKYEAVNSSTSLIIRCRESETAKFTPLHFSDENLMVGTNAHVDFINAQVGRIDIYEQKLFSVTYKWYIKGHEDVPLVTTTRLKQQSEGDENNTYTIEGAVFDDYTVKYDQDETYNRGAITETVPRAKKSPNYLGSRVGNVALSKYPYYSAGMDFYIPKSIKLNDGTLLDLAGQEIYCEVTYGLCYTRWQRAFKYLPVCDYRPEMQGDEQVIATTEAERGTVRETMAQKTFKTKAVKIKANPNPNAGEPTYWSGGATIQYAVDNRDDQRVVTQAEGTVCKLTYSGYGEAFAKQHLPNKPGEVFYITDGDGQDLDELIQQAIDSYPTHINTCPMVVLRNITWEYYDEAAGEWKDIKTRADKDDFLIEGDTLTFTAKEPMIISARATEKCWVIFDSATMIYYILDSESKDVSYSVELSTPIAAIGGHVITKEAPDADNGDLERDGWTYDVANKKLILKDFDIRTDLEKAYESEPRAAFMRDFGIPSPSYLLSSTYDIQAGQAGDRFGALRQNSDAFIGTVFRYKDTNGTVTDHLLWFADDVTIELQGTNAIVLNPDFLTNKEFLLSELGHTLFSDLLDDMNDVSASEFSCIRADSIAFTGDGSLDLVLAADPGSMIATDDYLVTGKASVVSADTVTVNLTGDGYVSFRNMETGKEDTVITNPVFNRSTYSHLPSDTAFIRTEKLTFKNGELRFQSTHTLKNTVYAVRNKNGSQANIGVDIRGVEKGLDYIRNSYKRALGASGFSESAESAVQKQNNDAKEALAALGITRDGLNPDLLGRVEAIVYQFKYNQHKHSWNAQSPEITYATATTPGSVTYTCACGETKVDEIPVFTVPGIEATLNGDGSVHVEWGSHEQAEKYDVYRAEAENGTYAKIASATESAYNDTAVQKGKTYYYKVKAVRETNSPLESPFSDVACVEIPAVLPETHSVTVTSGTASVSSAAKGTTVTVTASAAPEGKVFDKWEVVKGNVTLADAAANVTTFVMGDEAVEVKATYKDAGSSGEEGVFGDIDGDGNITAADARIALRMSVDIMEDDGVPYTEKQQAIADVDKDGRVTAADARLLLRKAVGLEVLSEGWAGPV